MEVIDISGWSILSQRPSSSNYISPDGRWMLKSYLTMGEDEQKIQEADQAISKAVFDMGIPTPEPGGLVRLKSGGIGALYQYIEGKKSLSRAISEDRSLMEPYMKKFVRLGRIIHSTECDTQRFPSIERKLLDRMQQIEEYSDFDKECIRQFIGSVPKVTTCLHGDFHPGNFITSAKGDFAIDLGGFAYGSPVYDWSQWFFMSHYLPEGAIDGVFHMGRADVMRCWEMSKEGCPFDEYELSCAAGFILLLFVDFMPGARNAVSMVKQLSPLFKRSF